MTYYNVYIDIGDHHWDVELTPTPGLITDDLLVLDGLRFGWSMPEGLWPQQPDPMTAALAVNVPDARDVADVAQGDPVAIEVTLHPDDTEPTFAFYGRVTDLRAQAREGRTGVTLSVIAVDYTADLTKLQMNPTPFVDTVEEFLEFIWDEMSLGDLPAWLTSFGFPEISWTVAPGQPPWPVRDTIVQHLTQSIGFSDAPTNASPDRRMILAPNIDPLTRRPGTAQPWMFDYISKTPEAAEFEVDGALVATDSLTWQFQKGNGPTRVDVTGYNQTPDNLVFAEHAGVDTHVIESIATPTLVDEADAQAVADFYLPPADVSRWRLEQFRYLLSRLDDLEGFYQGLMPYHTGPTGSPDDRAACYGHAIEITDVPLHRSPLAGTGDPTDFTTVTGRLSGVELVISGRHVSLDMQLRQAGTG